MGGVVVEACPVLGRCGAPSNEYPSKLTVQCGGPHVCHRPLQHMPPTLSACCCCAATMQVVHRDMKLENVLLDGCGRLRLIDFGLAAFFAPGKRLRVHCGSPSYAAPEIVGRRAYEGPPVDVWSTGVVLFAMLAGFLPFHSPTGNKQELCQKILAGSYNAPDWLSPGARDLLSRMLCVDPVARISLAGIAAHPWTRGAGPAWVPPSSHPFATPLMLSGTCCSSAQPSLWLAVFVAA